MTQVRSRRIGRRLAEHKLFLDGSSWRFFIAGVGILISAFVAGLDGVAAGISDDTGLVKTVAEVRGQSASDIDRAGKLADSTGPTDLPQVSHRATIQNLGWTSGNNVAGVWPVGGVLTPISVAPLPVIGVLFMGAVIIGVASNSQQVRLRDQ